MDELILFIVAFFPFSLVFYFIYTVIKGKGGSKGITEEYTSKSGVIRTAKKSREEHIVWFILGDSIHVLYFRMGMGYLHKHTSSISLL